MDRPNALAASAAWLALAALAACRAPLVQTYATPVVETRTAGDEEPFAPDLAGADPVTAAEEVAAPGATAPAARPDPVAGGDAPGALGLPPRAADAELAADVVERGVAADLGWRIAAPTEDGQALEGSPSGDAGLDPAGPGAATGADPASAVAAGSSPASPPESRWDALSSDPGEHLGQRVRLVVQHHSLLERWNPYLSRFGPRDHRALRAWSDEQLLWNASDHDAPALRLFVRRGGAADRAFETASTYQRFEVEGVVREVFAGAPWIELDAARPLPERVGEGALIHATRALSLIASERWPLAKAELERALEGELPARAREELERLLAGCVAASSDGRGAR